MQPPPVDALGEVVPMLTERGQLEWQLAVTRAQLGKALARIAELEEIAAPDPTEPEL